MKVTIKKESLDYLTVNEYEHAKKIVKDEREDEMPIKDYAEMAARAILNSGCYATKKNDGVREVFKAEASITRDGSTDWDRFGEGCGRLNVWIEAVAETFDGFLKYGFLLSDVWDLDGSEQMNERLAHNSYVRYFTEKES